MVRAGGDGAGPAPTTPSPPFGNSSVSGPPAPSLDLGSSLGPGGVGTGYPLTWIHPLPSYPFAQGGRGSPGPLQPGGAEQEEVL